MRWQDWMDRVVLERYADEKNSVLCSELSVNVRTLERHASALGVKKSKEFMERSQRKGVDCAKRWVEWMNVTGQKIRKRYGGGGFEKGHRLDPDIEERRVKAIRDRYWDERRRVIRGQMQKTKWKIVVDFPEKL